MNRKAILFIFIGSLLFVNAGFAQEDGSYIERINGFIGLQVGVPAKEMQPAIRNNMGNMGFGADFMIFTNPFSWGRHKRNSALRLGAEAGYTYYGRFLTQVDIRGYKGDYKTSYGILNLNAVLQLRPQIDAPVRPFFEVLAGGNFYLSMIRENLGAIESALGIPPFELDAYSSASFNKGVALGFLIGKSRRNQAKFTLRGSYNVGSDIKYVVRNSLAYNQQTGYMEYSVGKAPVRYFLIQAGVGF